MPQNHRKGFIEGTLDKHVYRLRPGAGSRTTLAALAGLPFGIGGGGAYDRQSVRSPRQAHIGFAVSPAFPV